MAFAPRKFRVQLTTETESRGSGETEKKELRVQNGKLLVPSSGLIPESSEFRAEAKQWEQ